MKQRPIKSNHLIILMTSKFKYIVCDALYVSWWFECTCDHVMSLKYICELGLINVPSRGKKKRCVAQIESNWAHGM